MKPLPDDYRHKLLISGDELEELKKHTYSMVEAFGLDRKIEKYMGTRPITLYRWDLECLMDVIDLALKDERDYPDKSAQEFQTLSRLGTRLHQEYDSVYGEEKALSVEKAVTLAKGTSSRKSPKTQATVYQLKITLADIKPPIWRRVEVEDCTLLKLNKIIQVCMGWEDCHMWLFEIGDEEYGDDVIDAGGDMDFASARKAKLSRFVQAGVKKFRYTYDMGDNWDHVIQVEKVLEVDPQKKYPRCVEGRRSCPPEDCGGPWGYSEYLAAIADPQHEQHEELLEWWGPFAPEAFDIQAVNKELATLR